MPNHSQNLRVRRNWVIAWILSVIPILGFWLTGLFDLDEGFYAAVAGEMLRRGEFITPHLNGMPWYEKPVLLYWFGAASVALFGEVVGPRLPSALAALGTYALVGWFTKREAGETAGQIAMVATGTMLLVVMLARLMMTDMLLLLTFSGALFTFYLSVTRSPNWRILSFALLGFSMLAKGPIGIGLMVFVIALLYWRAPTLRAGFKGVWVLPLLVMCGVIALWYVPAYLQNGQTFVRQFIIEQNIIRFLGGDGAHAPPFIPGLFFYVPVALVGFAPWIWVALAGLFKRAEEQHPLTTFCWIWAGTVFVFFTLSVTKLPHYILLMAPPIAILAALRLVRPQALAWPRSATSMAVAASLILAPLVNFAQWYWYGQTHAGLHRLVRSVRDQDARFSSYAMPEPGLETARIGTELQDTEHPSALFYLDSTALLTSKFDEVLDLEPPVFVFTRKGRIGEAHYEKAQQRGVILQRLQETPDRFELYKIKASGER